jgi:hypothetical protein
MVSSSIAVACTILLVVYGLAILAVARLTMTILILQLSVLFGMQRLRILSVIRTWTMLILTLGLIIARPRRSFIRIAFRSSKLWSVLSAQS